jgi:hypothetical protein
LRRGQTRGRTVSLCAPHPEASHWATRKTQRRRHLRYGTFSPNGAGPGGGGCLGLLWWEKNAGYEASVWDLAALDSMGKITIDASGTSYVPAPIIPVPLIARTQATACKELAEQLEEFLRPAG